MADYNSSYTGAEIDANIGKVANADTTPTSGSTDMITSGAVYTAVEARLPKAGGTMTGNIDMNSNSLTNPTQIVMASGGRITNLSTATDAQTGYAASVAYVLAKISASFAQFAAAVRATVLTGLSTSTATQVAETDTMLEGIGKLQAQINAGSAGGDMTKAVYDAADITEQLVGLTATQSLTNKTITDLSNQVHANLVHKKVKATEALTKGQPIRVTGYNSGENAYEVESADNTVAPANGVIGESLSIGEFGMAVLSGTLTDIDTSAFTELSIIYPNSSGGFTATEPATGYIQPLAFVLRSHATNGAIQILADYPKQRANDVKYDNTSSELTATEVQSAIDELNTDIGGKVDKITSTDNAIVRFDGTSGAVQNSAITIGDDSTLNARAIKGYRPTSTQTGTTYTFVLGDANSMVLFNNASAITVTIPNESDVAYEDGTEIEIFNLGDGLVTLDPDVELTVVSKDDLLSLSAKGAAAILKKIGSDSWILIGDLA